jgi:hypothetical protein
MRRRHFNATQKLRMAEQIDIGEDKTRLEQEVLLCGAGIYNIEQLAHTKYR